MIRAVRTITAKDLRERLRDKSFVLLGVLTPLVLAFVLNLVFGDLGEGELEVRMGVQDADQSEISAQFAAGVEAVDGDGGVEVTSLAAMADPEDALDEHGLDAVLVIPPGFGNASRSGAAPQLRLVEDPDRPVQAGVAGSIVDGFAAELERIRLAAAAGAQLGAAPDTGAPTSDLEMVSERPGGEGLNTSARMMAGMAVMFVFFTVGFGVTTLLTEKENGTLARLLAAPIPRDAIMASKGLVGYLLGVLATMILMIAATLLMGAEWGPWLGVVALVLAAVLTAVALMAVVAGIARTAEGAGAAQAIIAVGLAMLGGSWFPVAADGLLGALSRMTPHFWFLDGLEQLATSTSWTAVGPSVVALVVIGAVAGIPAVVLLRRRLVP